MHSDQSKIPQPGSDIIQRCKKKDEKAFKVLVEQFQSYAYSLAFRLVLNKDNAKDIVQESFIRIWKHIIHYDSKILFTTWLYKIVTNLCYDSLKSDRRRNNVKLKLADNQGFSTSENNHSGNFENKDLIRKIRQISRDLTLKQRMVFILRDLHELSIKEVSKILRLSEGAVKTNLYLARQNIKDRLLVKEKNGGA